MKILVFISLLLVSSLAYETFWKKGDALLDELQNGKKEIFVVTFYNPTPIKDDYTRQTANNKIQDELQSEVLNLRSSHPLPIRYASIDTTDRVNEKLIYKAGIKPADLEDGPVVLVASQGVGNLVWGPTVIRQVDVYVQEIQTKATQAAAASAPPATAA